MIEEWSSDTRFYKIESDDCVLRIYKNPCTFSLYDKDNNKLIFEEIKPIVYGKKSYQTLKRNDDDYAYVSACEYNKNINKSQLHKENLDFKEVKLTSRSYK